MATLPQSTNTYSELDKMEKEKLVNKTFDIISYVKMTREDDRVFGIIKCEMNGKQFTTVISAMLLDRLEAAFATNQNNEKSQGREKVFKEPVTVKMTKVKSKRNPRREYYNLE